MGVQILNGDCREQLRSLPDGSVHCCVTSPPYYGLRSYLPEGHPAKALEIGQEKTPDEFIAELVSVFREVRRVLRDDGTLWVNIGDSYAGGGNGGGGSFAKDGIRAALPGSDKNRAIRHGSRGAGAGIKPKDLIGIPWMLAFALRADGWYLRCDIIWAKPNGMPESVKDRPTRSHEIVFLLSKSPRYYYNDDALRTPPQPSTETRLAQDVEAQKGSERGNGGGKTNGPMKAVGRVSDKQRGHTRRHDGFNDRWDAMERSGQMANGANLKSVWWLAPAQFREAHYAVMPDSLARMCILGGCPPGGTVIDPFGGAGTTGLMADRLQRNAVLIELDPANAELIGRRIDRDRGQLLNLIEAAA